MSNGTGEWVQQAAVGAAALPPAAQAAGARPDTPGGRGDNPESERLLQRRGVLGWVERLQNFWTLGVLLLIVLAFGIAAPGFFSRQNWIATSSYAMSLLLLGIGQTFVIITAGIDLSDGAILGFSGMLSSLVMSHMWLAHLSGAETLTLGWIIALVTGAAVGTCNGLLITKLKLPPFIVTLGMLGIAGGATLLINNGNDVTELPPQVASMGTALIANWFPVPVAISLVLCLVFGVVLAKTRFGRRTYAIGSNAGAARRAGIHVDRHLIRVYALSGALAGVAGLLVTSVFADASPTAGANAELDAIAAVVIGGASLFGGTGSVGKTLIGSFVISILITGLILANVAPFWQTIAVGSIMIVAVYLDQLRRRILLRQ